MGFPAVAEPSSRALPEWIEAAHQGCRDTLGQLLEVYRRYLVLVARRELDPALRAKGGASDLVQDTMLEAQRDFARFRGRSEAELRTWLRRILLRQREEHTFEEIGQQLGRTAEAVRKLWARAIEHLQQELETVQAAA